MLVRFRPHSPDGAEALAVCPRDSNAKSPAGGSEDGVLGVFVACTLAGLVVPFHSFYF